MGPEVVDLLVALVSPANIEGKTYAQLSELLQKHYMSGINELAESYTFDTRYQKESETISDYIVALKKLSIHSGFRDEDQVKKRLRNRLVAGVPSNAIKNRLLSEGAALTWDKAVEISTSMDTARQNSMMMKPSEAQEVNRVQREGYQHSSRGRGKPRQKCYHCFGNHEAFKCPYQQEKCYNCNKYGHKAKACQNESVQKPQQEGKGGPQYSCGSPQSGRGRGCWQGRGCGRGRVHYADVERPEEEVSYASLYEVRPSVEEEYPESSVVEDTTEVVRQESLFEVKPSGGKDKEIRVDLEINGHSMPFTVDTASAVSIVSEDTYYEYLSHLQLQEPQINLKGYTCHEVKLLGQVDVAVKYEDQEKVLPLVIAKGDGTSLFGHSWIAETELDWGSLFSGKLGSQELKEGDAPKSHQVPCALKAGEEISRLETTCICKGESMPLVKKESTQEISVPKDSLVEELPDSLLSVEKQPTETKERQDEQLCYQDSLVEEPPDSFVSDNVPVVPQDGITPSSEDSLGKEPPDTVVCAVQSCVMAP